MVLLDVSLNKDNYTLCKEGNIFNRNGRGINGDELSLLYLFHFLSYNHLVSEQNCFKREHFKKIMSSNIVIF